MPMTVSNQITSEQASGLERLEEMLEDASTLVDRRGKSSEGMT